MEPRRRPRSVMLGGGFAGVAVSGHLESVLRFERSRRASHQSGEFLVVYADASRGEFGGARCPPRRCSGSIPTRASEIHAWRRSGIGPGTQEHVHYAHVVAVAVGARQLRLENAGYYRLRQSSSPLPIGTIMASTRSSSRAASSIASSVSRWLIALSAISIQPGTRRGATRS